MGGLEFHLLEERIDQGTYRRGTPYDEKHGKNDQKNDDGCQPKLLPFGKKLPHIIKKLHQIRF
jgi:hypothetical protein